MSFSDLGLTPELLRAVTEKGYDTPTPIQAKAIPAVLAGRDLLAAAQTGTGKTAGFVLPILQRLGAPKGRVPRALILAPTRELAAQVAESARDYGRYTTLRTQVVFGGVGISPQMLGLRGGCDILVATPGRLLDLANQRAVDLRGIECFVLDEADRMLDMGFINDIRRVIKLLPQQRQNLLFSATYPKEIRDLSQRLLHHPETIEVAARNATATGVEQEVYRVSREHKRHLLTHLIEDGGWHQVLVFTRTKHGANKLAHQLESNGIPTAAIHGNKTQAARVRALADFKANKVTALVATEVASRGLDIKELPQVVNYELPHVPEDYIHRIGRTGRAGASGRAVSLVSPDEYSMLRDIEQLLKRQLPISQLPEYRILAPVSREPHRHSDSRHSQSRSASGGTQSRGHGGAQSRPESGTHSRSSSGTRRFGGYRGRRGPR
jgi:ATP-dependent RNA helicase RhlE